MNFSKNVIVLIGLFIALFGVYLSLFSPANSQTGNDKMILYIFSADRCSSCRKAKPNFLKFAQKYKNNFEIKMIDVDDPVNYELAARFRLQYIPRVFILNTKTHSAKIVDENSYYNYENFERTVFNSI